MTITTEPAPSPEEAPAPTASRRKLLAVVAAVGVAVLAVAGWWLLIRDDSPTEANLPEAEEGSVGTIPPAASAAPDAEASTLLELLEAGRDLTFHATYEVTGDPELLGGELTIEVWRKDGRIRQDSTLVRPNTTVRTAGLVLGDDTFTCSQRDSEPWSCSSAPDPGTNEDGVFGSVAAELDGVDVTESTDTISGRDARCFSFPTGDGAGMLCLTPDGLPLKLSANGQELVLAEVESSVDDAVFEPPAQP